MILLTGYLGGKESTESFVAISKVISKALEKTAVPNAAIQLLTSRASIPELLSMDKYVDLVIPRGSNELVKYIKSNTKIPVLGHADGLCNIYIHADADPVLSTKVVLDSKTGYPAACNAAETLIVDKRALETVLPKVAEALLAHGVSLRCDKPTKEALQRNLPSHLGSILQDSEDKDYDTEFLDLIMAIKCNEAVETETEKQTLNGNAKFASVDTAIAWINDHSSHHTDAILTSDRDIAERFMDAVDSAGVYWNASTRFADGMRYGFGTEVGISTNKIHSRGPVGLEGLMIYKYKLRGSGQTAGDYGVGGKAWKHESLPL
jgi:glutamate-5-semialdehyde dehydrogenase